MRTMTEGVRDSPLLFLFFRTQKSRRDFELYVLRIRHDHEHRAF